MKKAIVMGLLSAATLSLATSAWAGYWSGYFAISSLDTAVDGYVVTPGTPIANPAGCTNASPIYMNPGMTAGEKDLMNKTLLSAFLANRKVSLNVASGACTAASYPMYIYVRVDAAQ